MNGSIDKDMLQDLMNSLKYREVIIEYKSVKYHIEAYPKKYVVGIFKKGENSIKEFIDIEGKNNEEAYDNLLKKKMFNGEALKDIFDKIIWIAG